MGIYAHNDTALYASFIKKWNALAYSICYLHDEYRKSAKNYSFEVIFLRNFDFFAFKEMVEKLKLWSFYVFILFQIL